MTPHAPEYGPGILLAHVARPDVVDGAPNPPQGLLVLASYNRTQTA